MSLRWSVLPALVVVCGLVAAGCTTPERPDDWEVQRVSPPEPTTEIEDELCADVRSLATGALDDSTELDPLLDELARIAAVTGATDALTPLARIREVAVDPQLTPAAARIATHDLLVAASGPIDETTYAACEIPLFTAMYAASGFADCHTELEIPVAAHMPEPDPTTCGVDPGPDYLPCFSADDGHLPVDCVTGVIVAPAGDRWERAGTPRTVEIDRTDPDAVVDPGPPVLRPSDAAACADLLALWTGPELPNGLVPDVDRLAAAVADLDPEIRTRVDAFIEASSGTPDLAEFEALVTELDELTAEACGLPLVSAWASIQGPVVEPLCWIATGVPYPAYEPVGCEPEDPA